MNRALISATLLILIAGCAGGSQEAIDVESEPGLENFDALWNYGDPAGTEAKFLELLPAAATGDDVDLHAQLLTQIGRSRGLQRDFDAAHAALDEAEALIGEAAGPARVRLLLERGRTFNSSGHRKRAIPLFAEALAEAERQSLEFHAVDAAHMLGIAEEGDGALDWNLKAIAMAEAASDPRARGWRGSLLNNTGWTYHERGEFETALDLFERALAFRREQGAEPGIRIARWCVARCQRSLGRHEEALAEQQALAAQLAAAGESDGYVHEELGELMLALERPEAARPHFARAFELLNQDPWLRDNEGKRLERLRELGGH